MKTLLIDNYDSFSHILFQYLWEVNGQEPIFIHNDEWTLERIQSESFDNILISPGPGRPDRIEDFGVCFQVMEAFKHVPLLGVCLGHQGLGVSAGARIVPAPEVRHGKLSSILHSEQGLFAGLPPGFPAMRYHSLVLEPTVKSTNMQILATSADDGQIMAIRLLDRPAFGVQFHPESIGTEGGRSLLGNFRDLTLAHSGRRAVSSVSKPSSATTISMDQLPSKESALMQSHLVEIRELPWRDPEAVFQCLFQDQGASFWLDSSASPQSGQPAFTYMGNASRLIEIDDAGARLLGIKSDGRKVSLKPPISGDPLEYMQGYLRNTEPSVFPETCGFRGAFRGGLIGYFGYAIKRVTVHGYRPDQAAHSPGSTSEASLPRLAEESTLPDALFMEPNRVLAFDHVAGKVYAFLPITAEFQDPEVAANYQDSLDWLDGLASRWSTLDIPEIKIIRSDVQGRPGDQGARTESLKLPWRLSADKSNYLGQIRNLQSDMLSGEAYETCLTNQASVEADADPWLVYRLLRRINPAPYSAFLHFPQGTVLSASPERFLKMNKGGSLSSRPIKGTRRRGANPEEDRSLAEDLAGNSKDRSENLMIVDLVRNDFGKVCAVGSVQVSESLVVETHPTVLQLVSGIEGKLKPGLDAMDAFRACFPGGSMTGAPKRRSIELLEAQECRERGVFSGALGYLGYDGAMDLGMVIRTLVCSAGSYSVGCGGAILTESDPETEFTEAMLKAFAPMQAVELAVFGECGNWRRGKNV